MTSSGTRPEPDRRFSLLWGGLRLGADWFERSELLASHEPVNAPRGLADALADFENPALDARRVHPAIAPFFEDPGALALRIESRWRGPFDVAWRWLLRPLLGWVGQFYLPAHEGEIATRVFAIDRHADGRSDARGVVRSYANGPDAGRVMQVVSYATWARGGLRGPGVTRYMSATFPLPGGHIAGLLRLDPNGEDESGRLAVALSSTRQGDDAGVYFVFFGRIPVRLPLGERLSLWAAGSKLAPADLDASRFPGTTLVGRHEQRLGGIRLVTHDYWFRPLLAAPGAAPTDRGARR